MENKVYNLCIVGAGPAGIIMALEYANLNPEQDVLLVEYGNGKHLKNSLDVPLRLKIQLIIIPRMNVLTRELEALPIAGADAA